MAYPNTMPLGLNRTDNSVMMRHPVGIERPYWSVMIPTFNCANYLRTTLESVLAQDRGPHYMQIEVVDDCSTKDDPEAVVRDIGEGRVKFFRQPKNVGAVLNFNTCIQRSAGEWVHILHGDDFVLLGFYETLEKGLTAEPQVGAAFCRHAFTDEHGATINISPLERETPGILENWIERIAVWQSIQCPAIVVNRKAYEKLGGFDGRLSHAADWEMWQRTAANFAFWYEPDVLACYRVHSRSDSSRLFRTGANIADIRRAIDISSHYLPSIKRRELTRRARENYSEQAFAYAREYFRVGDLSGAYAQIREAVLCAPNPRTVHYGMFLVKQYLLGQFNQQQK